MENDTAILDTEGFMVRLLNDPDLARLISENFLTDIPARQGSLHLAIEQESFKEAEEWAHAIKGAALTVSAGLLAQKALELEHALKAGAQTEIPLKLAELDRALKASLEAMTVFRTTLP